MQNAHYHNDAKLHIGDHNVHVCNLDNIRKKVTKRYRALVWRNSELVEQCIKLDG